MDKNQDQTQKNKATQANIHPDTLPNDLEKLIEYIPDDKKEEALKTITSLTVQKASFSGPLPPPSILSEYDSTLENGAERIMKMAEHQSNHRIELEKHAIKEELRQSGRGQIYGFILALIGMAIAFGLAYLGHDTVAGIFGTTTIVGLVTVFVLGRQQQNKESEE